MIGRDPNRRIVGSPESVYLFKFAYVFRFLLAFFPWIVLSLIAVKHPSLLENATETSAIIFLLSVLVFLFSMRAFDRLGVLSSQYIRPVHQDSTLEYLSWRFARIPKVLKAHIFSIFYASRVRRRRREITKVVVWRAHWVKMTMRRNNPRVGDMFASITKAFPIIVLLDRYDDWTAELLVLFLSELGFKARAGTFVEINKDWSLVLSVYSHEKIDSLHLQTSVEDAVLRAGQVLETISIFLAATSTSTRLNVFVRGLREGKWSDVTVERTQEFAHMFLFALTKFAESAHVINEFGKPLWIHDSQRRNSYRQF